jgi:hypothetical protein
MDYYEQPAVRMKPPRIKTRSEVIDLRATPAPESPDMKVIRTKPSPATKPPAMSSAKNTQASSTVSRSHDKDFSKTFVESSHDDFRRSDNNTSVIGHRLRSDSITSIRNSREFAAPLHKTSSSNTLRSSTSQGRRQTPMNFLEQPNNDIGLKCIFDVNHKSADVELKTNAISWSFVNQGMQRYQI